jgi:hypothetical protein
MPAHAEHAATEDGALHELLFGADAPRHMA